MALIVVALSTTQPVRGAFGELPLKWSNVRFGANAPTVHSFFKDSAGMMWVGTSSGLYAYDGFATHFIGQSDELSSSQIYDITERDGILWLATNNGLLSLDLETGVANAMKAENTPKELRCLLLDGDNLWLGSHYGLYRYNIAADRLESHSAGLPHQAVYSLLPSPDGNIWVGTYDGLVSYNPRKRNIERIVRKNNRANLGSGNTFVNAMAYNADSTALWVGTEDGLSLYNPADDSRVRIDAVGNRTVKDIDLLADGDVVIATDYGVMVYDGRTLQHYRHDSRQPSSIANNTVWSLFFDPDEDTLWAGTETGFSMSEINSPVDIVALSSITGLGDGNQIWKIFRDSYGDLWLGGTNGLIRVRPDGSTQWFRPENAVTTLSHNRVRDIYEGPDGELWVAGDGGINRFDRSSGRFVNYRFTDHSRRYNANWAYSVFQDRDSMLWVGGYLGGLFATPRSRVRQDGGTVEASINITDAGGLANNFVAQCVPGKDGDKWVLLFRDSTVSKIDGHSGEFMRCNIVEDTEGHMPALIAVDNDGRLWTGYDSGVVVYDSKGRMLRNIPFPQPEEGVSGTEAGHSFLAMSMVGSSMWASTSSGVWAIDTVSFTPVLLPIPERNYSAIFYDNKHTGKVVLGAIDEIVAADPRIAAPLISNDTDAPQLLYIIGVSVGGQNIPFSRSDLRDIKEIRLAHNEGPMTISLSSLHYAPMSLPRFRYTLDDATSPTLLPEGQNVVHLPKLSSGLHVLRLEVSGHFGHASYELHIRVLPPWYLSVWAILAYLVIIGLTTWFVVRYYMRKRNREEEERLRRETLDRIAKRMSFLSDVSHELKTPLSMIIGPVSRLRQKATDAEQRRQLDKVYNSAIRLSEMVHNTLEIENQAPLAENERREGWGADELIASSVNLVSFCRNVLDSFIDSYPGRRFHFDADESLESLNARLDPVKLESMLNNLLSNACKYTPEDADVTLAIAVDNSGVFLSVEDNGPGILEEEQPFVFRRLYRSPRIDGKTEGSGLGLWLVSKYAEMHGGTVSLESPLPAGAGTCFTIALPISVLENLPEGHAATPLSSDGSSSHAPSGKAARVLVIDDNAAIAEFIKTSLEEDGRFVCKTAANGEEGIAEATKFRPTVIVTDEMMPVMSGLEMVEKLKAIPALSETPIIMLTAKDDTATATRCADAGINVFMSKPFDITLLAARIAQLAKQGAPRRASLLHTPPAEQDTSKSDNTEVKNAADSDDALLRRIAEVVEAHIAEPGLSVAVLSDKTSLNPRQLNRLLKKHLDVSPVDYIRMMRMRQAARLLTRAEAPGARPFTVSEVMYMVGFSSPSYFSKCFRAHYGCSPAQYAQGDNGNKQ